MKGTVVVGGRPDRATRISRHGAGDGPRARRGPSLPHVSPRMRRREGAVAPRRSTRGSAATSGTSRSRPEPLLAQAELHADRHSGRPYDFAARTRGKLTYLYFGYTHCPDACPATMGDIAFAVRSARAGGPQAGATSSSSPSIRVETLRGICERGLDHYDPSFVGLTGSEAAGSSRRSGPQAFRSRPLEKQSVARNYAVAARARASCFRTVRTTSRTWSTQQGFVVDRLRPRSRRCCSDIGTRRRRGQPVTRPSSAVLASAGRSAQGPPRYGAAARADRRAHRDQDRRVSRRADAGGRARADPHTATTCWSRRARGRAARFPDDAYERRGRTDRVRRGGVGGERAAAQGEGADRRRSTAGSARARRSSPTSTSPRTSALDPALSSTRGITAIAYETVETGRRHAAAARADERGRRAASPSQAGAYYLEKPLGGRGCSWAACRESPRRRSSSSAAASSAQRGEDRRRARRARHRPRRRARPDCAQLDDVFGGRVARLMSSTLQIEHGRSRRPTS